MAVPKEKFLSHRLLDDYDAIEAAVCAAWKRIISETGRLTSLTSYPDHELRQFIIGTVITCNLFPVPYNLFPWSGPTKPLFCQ